MFDYIPHDRQHTICVIYKEICNTHVLLYYFIFFSFHIAIFEQKLKTEHFNNELKFIPNLPNTLNTNSLQKHESSEKCYCNQINVTAVYIEYLVNSSLHYVATCYK